MLIKERIQLIMKMHNLTASALADQLGVQRSNISHIISGRNKPSLDLLEKLILKFPRVNAHWLITGEVKTIENQSAETASNTKSIQNNSNAKLVSVVKFYSDGSCEEFNLRKE